MQFSINTESLQEMVGKVIRCSSNNKLIPLTSLMSIKVKANVLTLTTTDATTYFYVSAKDKVDCEDFEVSVIADIFTKLIQKTTSKTVSIKIENNILEVHGNGTHKIELPLDENGSAIKFPNRLPENEPLPTKVILRAVVDKILNYNKSSLAQSVEMPALCNYYCGKFVLSSDMELICKTDAEMFETPLLITPQVMELLGVMSEEKINALYNDEYTLFWTATDTIYAPITEGIENFPAEPIENLIQLDIPSGCKVSKEGVLNLLDRLALFVSSYDKREITMTFTNEGIMFNSLGANSTEVVPYISSENFKDFTCGIDIEKFKSQISAIDAESIDMRYGSEDFVKLISGNVTMLVALADDEEEENGEE